MREGYCSNYDCVRYRVIYRDVMLIEDCLIFESFQIAKKKEVQMIMITGLSKSLTV